MGMEGMIVTGCLFLSANAASIPAMFKVGGDKIPIYLSDCHGSHRGRDSGRL